MASRPDTRAHVRGGPDRNWAQTIGRVLRPINLPATIYYETQVRSCCNIHALNMLIQAEGPHHTIREVFRWIHQQQQTPLYEHHREAWVHGETRKLFTESSGAMCPPVFGYWLFAQLDYDLQSVFPHQAIPSIDLDRLDRTLDRLQRFKHYAFHGFLVGTRESSYGHCSTLLRHQGLWYWLDSEKPERACLSGTSQAATRNLQTLREKATDISALFPAKSFDECLLIHQLFSSGPTRHTTANPVDPDPASPAMAPTAAPTAPLGPALPHTTTPKPTASPTHPDPMEIDPQPLVPPTQPRRAGPAPQ